MITVSPTPGWRTFSRLLLASHTDNPDTALISAMTENPLVKLGDLTKPATFLIEKISDAVGGIFKPHQIV